jgi:hypothetical protein
MKKVFIGIFVLAMLALLIIAGCSPAKTVTSGNPAGGTQGTGTAGTDQATTPDGYVNDQIVDENSTVEIGELV